MTRVRFGNRNFMPVEFKSVFNDFFNNTQEDIRFRSADITSAVNVVETPTGTELQIALPGIDKNDVDIKLNNDILEIEVKHEEIKEEKDNNYRRVEFDFSKFKRSFQIPDFIDHKKIEAHFDKGVLVIELPKKEEVIIEPKRIEVK